MGIKSKRRTMLMLIDLGIILSMYAFAYILMVITNTEDPGESISFILNFLIFAKFLQFTGGVLYDIIIKRYEVCIKS